jgi:hypothetical protein
MMNNDKRSSDMSVPDNINDYLTDAQFAELHHIESFGWTLKYIRRPLFQERVVVVMNPDGSSIGILEEDGRLNLESNIDTRE